MIRNTIFQIRNTNNIIKKIWYIEKKISPHNIFLQIYTHINLTSKFRGLFQFPTVFESGAIFWRDGFFRVFVCTIICTMGKMWYKTDVVQKDDLIFNLKIQKAKRLEFVVTKMALTGAQVSKFCKKFSTKSLLQFCTV